MEFVTYHNRPGMGYPLQDGPQFAVLTNKPPNHMIGHYIWVVEGFGSPRQYYIRQRFYIDGVEDSDVDGFAYRFHGEEGENFQSEVSLRNLDWFPEFLKSVGNFGIGAQALDESTLAKFLSVTNSTTSSK